MAIDIQSTELGSADGRPQQTAAEFSLWEVVKTVLAPVASLKLTVVLFALSIVLIFVGTLAQVDKDIWEVIGQYFRCWFASVPFQVFVPPSFVVSHDILDAQDVVIDTTYYFMGLIPLGLWKEGWKADDIPGGFWFPGGKLIGLLLAANLLSAHLIRFKAEARGAKLLGGLAAIAVGCIATAFVIVVSNSQGIQSEPAIPYQSRFKLTDESFASLRAAGVRDSVLSKLDGLKGNEFESRNSLMTELAGILDKNELAHFQDRVSNRPFYRSLWIGFEGLLALLGLAAACGTVQQWSRPLTASQQAKGWFVRGLLAVVTAGLIALVGWLVWSGTAARPSDASLRILWQLIQSSFAGVALLAGCWVVFRKKAGIVLLHAGVGLMMYYELHVALTAIETQMNIEEGETTNFVQDIRTIELAVIDRSNPDKEAVVTIPRSLLLSAAPSSKGVAGKPIDVPELPFQIEVAQFLPNSHLRKVAASDTNPATAGVGTEWLAEPKRKGAGVDTDSKVDVAAIYVTLTAREGRRPLGTYLVSMWTSGYPDTVRVGDRDFDLTLRPKRYYKDYRFTLKDVRKEDYLGTRTPRNYASTVHIVDKTRNVDEEKTIWMNNPLRFANETFYQSSYHRDESGVESTVLSVVANSGWMMPYVSCALVAIGMLAHFLLLLVRFLTRGDAPDISAAQSTGAASLKAKLGIKPQRGSVVVAASLATPEPKSQWLSVAVAATLVLAAGAYIASKAMPPESSPFEYDLAAFGRIPVVYQGRVKPLETAAQSALLEISGKSVVEVEDPNPKPLTFLMRLRGMSQPPKKQIPAIQFMLDVISESDAADEYKVFRVENLELHETMGVKKREGMRYSRNELRPRFELTAESFAILERVGVPKSVLGKLAELKGQRLESDVFRERLRKLLDQEELAAMGPMVVRVAEQDEFHKQVNLARTQAGKDRRGLSVYQRKVLELSDKLSTFDNIQLAFGLHRRIDMRSVEGFQETYPKAIQFSKAIAAEGQPVFAVGPVEKGQQWRTLSGAWLEDLPKKILKEKEADPSVTAWEAIHDAYTKKEAKEFNRAVEAFLGKFRANPPRDVNPTRVSFETFFNRFQPFAVADRLYLVAFILAACGWLGWTQGFNRAAFWLQVLTLGLHTFALIGCIYISGRPPVTNLYSSAIFVGWGCVVLGLILEVIYRIGIGSLIASVAGYATLLIADSLGQSGDTFTVLQAVLDTQFWLATHVTCITFGYATTYLAGLLGIVYVLRGLFTPSLTRDIARDLNRMIYGTLCFSIFFSFVGTVLGGLWADDSWGRFWGWDPKENGALIIVLWNALALHARWGGMVKERGLAVLAIAGNIFVSWSWWGVNLLGAGLHAYADSDGTATMLMYLLLFAASQVALIAIGSIPKAYWRSFRALS